MALNYTVATCVTTTAVATGHIRLFHGTLVFHAGSVARGIDFAKCNSQFWATPNLELARYFYGVADQQWFAANAPDMLPGNQHAIVAFDFPIPTIAHFEEQSPSWLLTTSEGYCFLPACSTLLQTERKNIEIAFEE
jgi:hypothetical protein